MPVVPRVLSLSLVVLTVAGLADAAPPTCAIDMGSNTFKRIVGRFEQGRYAETSIEKVTLAVGDDVARNGLISDGKLAEIDATLGKFKDACVRDGATTIAIAARHSITMVIADERRESESRRARSHTDAPEYRALGSLSRGSISPVHKVALVDSTARP